MSERTHSPTAEAATFPTESSTGGFTSVAANLMRKRKLTMVFGGAVAAALIGGILFQVFRAEPGEAGAQNESGANRRQRSDESNSRVLARVDGRNITWKQVADECMARHGRDVLENLINRTVIQQACAKRKVVVTKSEVANEVRRIAHKFNLTPENWYQMLQAERGITPIQYHRDIIWPMLALKKIAGTKVEVTEEEMREAFVREFGPRVKAKLIMLDNQRRAGEVHQTALRNPQDFGRLAQKFSIEPNSKALWGEIPPIKRHGGNKKIEDVAFQLRDGEISPIIQVARNRFVIIKCEGRTKPVVKDLRQVREDLYAQIKEEKIQASVARVFEKLKRETTVDNFITGQRTGIQQTSGTKPGGAGSARIRSRYPLPSNPRKKSPTFK